MQTDANSGCGVTYRKDYLIMEETRPAIKPAARGEAIMPIHGTFNFKCGPGVLMSRVGFPNVVITTTSDWRTWKTNSSRPTMTMSKTPMAIMSGFLFMV